LEAGNIFDELFFEDSEPNRNLLPRKQFDSGKTIVVADDNQSLRFYTSILLEQQGFTVLQASNGKQVLEELQHKAVDLILMDLEMPQLNGLETTSAIRKSQQQYAEVPILGHTGDSSESVIAKIEQVGMNDYIIKPAATEKLLDKIANWI
jgi:two-component system CAI-1 autoinducer sensor kinase/phosphatase CqsS